MGNSETPFDTEIKELDFQIQELSDKRNGLAEERAIYLCPFKVGQTLINSNGKKAVLESIKPSWGKGYRMKGYYLLKDGSRERLLRELYWYDKWKLSESNQ